MCQDEMSMAIKGLNFLIAHVKNEVFTFNWEKNEQVFVDKVCAEVKKNLFIVLEKLVFNRVCRRRWVTSIRICS